MNLQPEKSIENARQLDSKDPLTKFRDQFHIPVKQGKEVIYLCGNSLGLQPKISADYVQAELEKWKTEAVEGHFAQPNPWVSYHKLGKSTLAELLGARENEVVAMNNLTTNLHLMLASFYDPKGKRKKVIIESGAFPSDHFAVASYMNVKGVDPNEDLITLEIPGDGYLSTSTILESIASCGEELALVMLPGIQYYTGQFFNIPEITKAAHNAGAYVGFDLAHAIGNLPMNLHDDEVDFAVWCSYKYLNSGPGGVGGAFVHERINQDKNWPRLAGWWGQNEKTRFKMETSFDPMPSIDGWMLSNVNIVSSAAHLASLSIFQEAGINRLRQKSKQLTGYLEMLIQQNETLNKVVRILTPSNPDERGCQLSCFFSRHGREVFETLSEKGVVLDWREPNVIRVAPTPLYNTFEEVFQFVEICENIIKGLE